MSGIEPAHKTYRNNAVSPGAPGFARCAFSHFVYSDVLKLKPIALSACPQYAGIVFTYKSYSIPRGRTPCNAKLEYTI